MTTPNSTVPLDVDHEQNMAHESPGSPVEGQTDKEVLASSNDVQNSTNSNAKRRSGTPNYSSCEKVVDSGCSDNRESKRIRLEEDANANERPDRPDSATDVQISESVFNVHEFIEEKNARQLNPLSSESGTTPENGNEDDLEYLALATQVLNGSLPHDAIAYMNGMQVDGGTNGESITSVLLPSIPNVNLHTISPFIYGTPPDWKPIRIARIAIPVPTYLLEKLVMAPPSSLSTPSSLLAVSPTPGSSSGSSLPLPPTQELDRPAELPVPKTESHPTSASNTAEFECQETFLQSPPVSASSCSSAPTQVISTGSGDTSASVLSAYDSMSASYMLSQPYELSERIIEKMEAGEDNRTSLKIRHVPHSVTIDQLEEMIKNVVGPRKIDFLHLPRFKNGDNVGYGFVNFIHMKDLVSFVKKTENIKYAGTKTEVQLGIATVQSKEELIQKHFTLYNPEEWQIRIYHSDGPYEGLLEGTPVDNAAQECDPVTTEGQVEQNSESTTTPIISALVEPSGLLQSEATTYSIQCLSSPTPPEVDSSSSHESSTDVERPENLVQPPALSRTFNPLELDIDKIKAGKDDRTAIMFKDVPPEVTGQYLEQIITEVCGAQKIDFLYLPGKAPNFVTNAGYAFVNFIQVEDLLQFSQQMSNQLWSPESTTVVKFAYATLQTKEKFVRRYCINKLSRVKSTVPQEWQPRLFHPTGPQQGLPEDLPGLEDPQYILSSPQTRKYEVVQEALAGNIGNLLKEKPGDVTGLDLGDFF
ncbi:uncharacterized protein C8R40DRAFT_1102321 [Lentinula edodes]|uniref:uncharacterized protein n=1 Tax=Lentinula edodes TaxID=5353 RepID=UPI001E8ED6D8|nr:uncharacterized protein C8R40DRAFT_1102321 [Lentinula edodes]KAH7875561.1 hypothetical protein C8R40DRAFT_1102321 [Lentinula edodes]